MALGRSARRAPPVRNVAPQTAMVPAPIGGVNARDALAEMPQTDAVSATNWFGTPAYITPRNGNQLWASGLPAAVDTVMAYNGLTLRKLFAASGTAFYDITAQGAVGAAVVSALSNARWQHAMFNAGGGNVLLAVNGADAPRRYDGAVQGALETTTTLVGGTGYTATGTYTAVPLMGGTGTLGKATIVVAGGAVTSVVITTPGSGYVVGDVLSASNANLGGAGSGFSVTVQTVGGWSVTTISGTNSVTSAALNPNNLITVTVFQNRCWYIENNTMNCWYTTVTGFQGVLTMLPLGGLFKKGGYLMQMATWSVDNVAGMNDYGAFITSEGEVAIYQGYDPTQLATWQLVGVFEIGRPIGRRCWVKYGSDVLIITADGVTPLSKAMLTDRVQADAQVTFKIFNAINADVQNYSAVFGWQIIDYPLGNKLILNVPEVANTTMHQWVMNSVVHSWWTFRGWNANCWELQQDALYYGENTRVYLADNGTSDSGAAITVDCKPAFSYFGQPGMLKNFLMAQPVFFSSTKITPQVTLNIDYNDVSNPSPPFTAGATSPWDTSPWDVTPWGDTTPTIPIQNWQGISGFGRAASGRISFQIKGIACQWFATNYLFEPAGPL